MSFLQDSLINNTELHLFSEDDSDNNEFIKQYYAGKKSEFHDVSFNSSVGEEKLEEYNKHKNTIVNAILDYNYLRYLNSQLSLAILAGIYFNYELLNMDE